MIYGDKPLDVLAVVSHPPGKVQVKMKVLPPCASMLRNVLDNVFNAIKKDHRMLFWTAPAEDKNRSWHFERRDGSFTRAGKSLFWYGVHDVADVEGIVKDFEAKGRIERPYLPVGLSAPPHRAAASAPSGMRSFLMVVCRPFNSVLGLSRGYAAAAPLSTEPKRLGLIGAHRYTSQALTTLSGHPFLNLTQVSSRQLAGYLLEGYTKDPMTYPNLSCQF